MVVEAVPTTVVTAEIPAVPTAVVMMVVAAVIATEETLAMVAYRNGDYKLALREFRTAFRMNGYLDYLPMFTPSSSSNGAYCASSSVTPSLACRSSGRSSTS